jgi:general stress protein YciG
MGASRVTGCDSIEDTNMETFTTQQQNSGLDGPCTQTPAQSKPKQLRGFAILGAEKRKEIARKGGKTAHAMGRAHRFSREEAKIAGQKGGRAKRSLPEGTQLN